MTRFIQRQADSTPCDGLLRLPGVGPDGQGIDPALYARSFPDSYFDPSRRSVPVDHGDRSLPERADDACNGVVCTVLPLGDSDWRCAVVRRRAGGGQGGCGTAGGLSLIEA